MINARTSFIVALAAAVLVLVSFKASAQAVSIERDTLGSGTPGVAGFEQASPVLSNDILHVPQYMPNYPTAATIWPRIVEVPCIKVGNDLKCEGYQWTPKLGRGEYLFFSPVVQEPAKTVTVEKIVLVPTPVPGPERIVLKEVPVKPKTQ